MANSSIVPSSGDGESPASTDRDSLRLYYSIQYQRIAQHENGRLQVGNFVVAASVVALGLLALPQGGVSAPIKFVPLAVAFVNFVAIIYSFRSRYWVKLHQGRAKAVLAELSPRLVQLQTGADRENSRPNSDRDPLRSQLLLVYIHGTIAVLCMFIFGFWLLS